MGFFEKLFGKNSKKEIKLVMPLVDEINTFTDSIKALSNDELKAKTEYFKQRLENGEELDALLPEAFAVVREASTRVIGLRHYDVQLIGGVILHQGRIAEMKTGEGKTLVATLPAYLNALSGKGVHIVTVNDYLARRDSEWMGKVYRFLGLKVGLNVHGLSHEEKQDAYNADITYGTNNEFGFDYLRDNMVIYKESMVQRGHHFSIVDEVDSILVDEARTPLIISGAAEKSTELYNIADRFVKNLKCVKVTELNDKESYDELDADYVIDEKAKTAILIKNGIKKSEQHFNLENLSDPENSTISHHINQAIKAYGIMTRDIDYVVKDGEAIIVDEFTGRLMFGRRYSNGLHQAIEAKEKVKVENESKTLATITFQNYFRLYNKLSGMTGTALTEETEFQHIYKLDVVEIPTNKPMVRKDQPDIVYKIERCKFEAVIEQIVECNKKGQPVLVGTISIERSELLSLLLSKRGVKHEVLNAKQHEKEAQIISQAGKKNAVTIATNMAGRGTDIMLGGNAEYMARAELKKQGFSDEVIVEAVGFAGTDNEEINTARKLYNELFNKHKQEVAKEAQEVKEAGGLFILGTERHESRRIDNQLRGRAGRQGDPGESRFFVSLEDDLMRLFGGDRVLNLMNTLRLPDDQPIEAKILSNSIETAQKRVEGINFDRRKHVLQYDDVMNKQREIIYGQRRNVLNGDDLKGSIIKMTEEIIDSAIHEFTGESPNADDWDFVGLRTKFDGIFLTERDLHFTVQEMEFLSKENIKEIMLEKAKQVYENTELENTPEIMREAERVLLLQAVDRNWMEHIDAMDDLREGIGLRAYAQRDPIVEYRMESYDMFEQMVNEIKDETVRNCLNVRIRKQEQLKREQVATPTFESHGDGTETKQPVKKGVKVGRNEPCPCGSGKKFKKCCGAE